MTLVHPTACEGKKKIGSVCVHARVGGFLVANIPRSSILLAYYKSQIFDKAMLY